MTAKPAPADEPRCPRCGESRLLTYDITTGKFACDVCSATWRRKAAR